MPARYQVNITQSGQEDVEKIWSYIANDSPKKATQFINALEKKIKTLEQFPLRCSLIPENEILQTNYRHFIFGKYRAIYRIDEKIVYVMRIIHGARLLDISGLSTNYL